MTHPPSGILLVDKPASCTSHDVVSRVRRLAGTRKVGHAGTLDPMATGLLILGLGTATRLLTYMVGLDKEYDATVRLGQSTNTDDAEGDVIGRADAAAIVGVCDEDIAREVTRLTGRIEQVPSSVSAIKIAGKRAYARARAGEDVVLPSRPVTVSEFTVTGFTRTHDSIDLNVRIACSSGTYIRALARDLGDALGIGGHVTVLRRTRVGPFLLAQAHQLPIRVGEQRKARSGEQSETPRSETTPQHSSAEDAQSPHMDRPEEMSSLSYANTEMGRMGENTSPPYVNAEDARPLHGLDINTAMMKPADAATRLFPRLDLTAEQGQDLSDGKRIAPVAVPSPTDSLFAAIAPTGALVGLVSIADDNAKSVVNFPQADSFAEDPTSKMPLPHD